MADQEQSGSASRISLSEMIEDLRKELEEAAKQGVGEVIVFEIEKVELEAKVVVSKTGKADAKVQFWVVSAGGGYERGSQDTQTVKLTLLPKSAVTGMRTEVGGVTERKPRRD
jgi:hypothetical protein